MRLKSIRLAGFKSFVDPITIPVSASLIGVVGPNGCGKSNIIDAVRWVMGESSAKHLRGDSMADVIFNGSNSRKPVGKASVELIFDNSDGTAGGEYAKYAEIAIRREAGRDGQSDYFLNKTRCRRKDITGLFLGTGLGPRAYSIIEQGMVTRIIEAKPEDLRGFVEEAAGISKYKERRRETENRIKHARENLSRVEDIRQELASQLDKLKRQSRAAARYKELKAQERLMKAQLIVLRWRGLDEKLTEQDGTLRHHQTEIDAALAVLREVEAAIEDVRSRQVEANDAHNGVQREFYGVGAEISRIEQAIEHARETREAQQREQDQLNRSWSEASQHLEFDQSRVEELGQRLEQSAPHAAQLAQDRASADAALQAAETAMQAWQEQWDAFAAAAAEPEKVRDIQGARIEQLNRYVNELQERRERLAREVQAIAGDIGTDGNALQEQASAIDADYESKERSASEHDQQLREVRDEREALDETADQLRGRQHSIEARLESLRELQRTARGEHDAKLVDWLGSHGLREAPRLGSTLSVERGWERAVERVLGARLGAVTVDSLDKIARAAAKIEGSPVTLVERGSGEASATGRASLLSKIRTDIDLGSLLGNVFIADSLDEALKQRRELGRGESIITADGSWVGSNWLIAGKEADDRAGWLGREREIESLDAELAQVREQFKQVETDRERLDARRLALEEARDALAEELAELNRERVQVHEQLGRRESRVAELTARRERLEGELAEIEQQVTGMGEEIRRAQQQVSEAEASRGGHEARRTELQSGRSALLHDLNEKRAAANAARDALHRVEIERQALQTEFDATRQSIARLEGQLKHLSTRREELSSLLSQEQAPQTDLQTKLNEFLSQRVEIEQRLNAARAALGELDNALREKEHGRHEQERVIQTLREAMEAEKVKRQELLVRRDTQLEQLADTGFELAPVLGEMPAEANEPAWTEELEAIVRRIERLGPINLVAIEEFDEASTRKQYLDKQYEDLAQALTTLEEAMRKIDRETRTRFKETFDKVNAGFQTFFPQLFGGGSAYLELTDNDLLETGVTVMARPPGKRNSTIHLLSGGEKALTAVALLFSIFELNPAPFCLLDEVDAPLDDANVERYCETLKTMSQRTQLMYVTHNKISMEMANMLIGVTMSEPGVSRLVAVDVEEALEMVAQ